MKRRIAWFMSAMMLFSSVPSGSVNVLAEGIQQEAELLSDSAGLSDAEQDMAEDSIQNVPSESPEDISVESLPAAGEAVEEASVFGDGDEQADGNSGNEVRAEDGQEVTAGSIFSDAEDGEEEFETEPETGSETGSEEIFIGSNTLNITNGTRKGCKFTAQEDGTYRFRILSEWVSSMTIKDSSWDGLYMEPSEENFMDWSMEKDEICYVELNVTEGAGDTLELSVKRLCEVHTPAEDSVVVTDSTCTEEGYTTYTCEVCEESFTVDYTEPSGHQYAETETVEPTCDEYGYTIYTCENCGESYTDNYTDALGHRYSVTEALDATCTEEGYNKYTCDICGEEYDEYVAPYHQLDESGRCTVCQEVSPNVMINADLTVEGEETYIALEYDAEDYCTACIEIYAEDTEELFLKETLDAGPDKNTGKVFIYEELPQYFIIKAYFIDTDTEKTISNIYTNLLHTRAFQELDSYVPSDFEEERTVEFSGGNFGVFKEDTVVIHGNAQVNTLVETSYEGVTYTLMNTDDQADSIEQGCNLAYFYNDELKLVVHVSGVSRPADRTVTITVEQPALEEVFEHLRIDEVAQNQVCTVDLSGLPQGVSYGGAAAAASTQDAAAAVAGASELAETQTTLSASQEYSFTGVKISNAELNGNISVDMKFPIKLYITQSQQMMQFGVDATLSGNVSVEGEGSLGVPLGGYWVPLMNGVMYIKMNPKFLMKTEGSISFGVSAAGSVLMQTDNANGFRILSKSFDANDWKVNVEGSYFCGLQVNPELYVSPNCRLAGASLELGPEVTASLTTPIPEEEQEDGDHTCQACIDGDGDMVAELSADITAFKKKVSSSTSFKLKGFEFYYSLDHLTGGRGTCPYRKGAQNQQYKPDEWDDIGSVVEIGLYDCTLYADGTCVIRNATVYNTQTIILPSTLTYKDHTYRVTAFDGYESRGYTAATHLVIPESIKKFRYLGNSFAKLETVEFSGSRDKINDFAFSGCEKLKYIEIPDGVKVIGKFAFEDCSSLQSITIPDSVRSVEYQAFSNCSSLSRITLPEGMTSIASEVFLNCSSLTSVVIPDSVESIGEPVFVECSSLNRIVVGKNVDHVGHLEATVNPSSTHYWDYYNYDSYAKEFILSDGIKFIEANAFEGYDNLTHITIPDSVEYIGRGAFSGCISLKNISIPDGVRIGSGAFSGCKSLTDVDLPGDIKEIRAYVFEGCDSLNNIVLPDSVLSIGNGAFSGCDSLKSITLPDSVLSIGGGAFSGCDSLNNITLPDGITTIEDCTFADCSSLDSFIILDSIKTIGRSAFFGCSSLKSIIIPDNVESIGRSAFDECGSLTEMTIGKNVKIDCYYGWGCTEALETVYLSEGREEIDDYAFLSCTNLKTIALPDSLKRIGKSAFRGCTSLKEVKLPEGLKEIGTYAFTECDSFTSFVIPDSVETIGNNAVGGCNLSEMTIGKNVDTDRYWSLAGTGNVTTLHLSEGIEEIKDQTFYGYSDLKSITIPGSVKRIGESAFTGCKNLEEVIMSEGLKEIGYGAFMYCNGLTSIVIPDSVETIGSSTFYNCQNLTDVKLPLGVTEIENNLFTYCSSLTSVTIPDHVETIKSCAFLWCSGLEKVVIPDSVKTIGNSAFSGCEKLSELTIGKNVEIDIRNWECHRTLTTVHLSEGRTTIGKGSFSNAQELENVIIPESVKYIEEEAFWGCKSLSSVIIPNSVETLGKAAFGYCENLTEVTLSSQISVIDEYAFCECSRLSEIILSSAITEIRYWAFASCTSLKRVFIPSNVEKIGEGAFSGCTGLTQAVIAGKETNIECYNAFPAKTECPGLQIYGLSGSVAESTATQQNFTPLAKIDEEGHGYVTDRVITPSTCAKPGKQALKCILCGDCGKTDTVELPVSDDHKKVVKDPLVPASIGVSGKTAGSHCTACGRSVVKQEIIPAIKKVALSRTSYIYNGKVQKPSVSVKDSRGKAISTTQYTVSYSNASSKNAGKYSVTVTLKGNYSGSKSLSYTIGKASQKITASEKTVTLGDRAFSLGAKASGGGKLSYKTDNKAVALVSSKGVITIKGVGKATITINASANTNYNAAPARKVTVTVLPKKTAVSKVSSSSKGKADVSWKKVSGVNGYSVQYSTSSKFSGAKTVTVKGSSAGSTTLKSLKSKKDYYVRVCTYKKVGSKTYYSNWSSAKKVKIK